MSDKPTDDTESETSSDEAAAAPESSGTTSIFDVFEPPPEVDPNKFGPVPIVTDEEPPVDDSDDAEVIAGGLFDLIPAEPLHEPADSDESDSSDADAATGTAPAGSLPHWTEPPTGQVPSVVSGEPDVWSELTGPTWQGEGPDSGQAHDLADVFGEAEIASHGGQVDPGPGGVPGRHDADPYRRGTGPEISGLADDLGGRNVPQAILVGVIFAGLALFAFRLGNLATVILITAIVVLAAIELYNAMRLAGLHPATLLGITASAALPLATYNEAEPGFVMVIALSVVFGALWYIVGADTQRPALNLGLTMLGIGWIGALGSFAVFIILLPDGISILVAGVIATIASDTGAYAGGKAFGSRKFHPASPNKTWEGTIIGVLAAVLAGLVVGLLEISPFSDNLLHAVLLGLVVGILAPIGDLTESLVKRDLGVKDMGTLLPGHGGILDRVDGLLFMLPGVYYLALVLDLAG